MEVDLTVSSSVLKQGEVLTVNCTVKDTEMVFFSWDFPRRQVPVYLPVSLSVCTHPPVWALVKSVNWTCLCCVGSGGGASDRLSAQSDPLLR